MADLLSKVNQKQEAVYSWLDQQEKTIELPLYSSVDIRDAGFKAAVVDTNLFPGGFNNLCEHGLADAVGFMKAAILARVPKCENILIIAEEHTRNTWYLENIRILEEIITKAGFQARIATFISVEPAFCDNANYVELETAANKPVRIFCLKKILNNYQQGRQQYDLIIMNNDLTTGIPEILKNSKLPIYPSLQAGWHARLKSHHFELTQELIDEFAKIINIDSWFFSCFYDVVENVNINVDFDRQKLMEKAENIFKKVAAKYKEHDIDGKPYLFLKSDSGTYGMGVEPIEKPEDILTLNRKIRNNLNKGKSAQIIDRFLIQEGVPTIYNIDDQVSEVSLYQIENNIIGGFYRLNSQKTDRQNLNSQGMSFKKMCPHLPKYGICGVHHDMNIFDLYRILARIAVIAAHREVVSLEASKL